MSKRVFNILTVVACLLIISAICRLPVQCAPGTQAIYPLGEPVTADKFLGMLQHDNPAFQIPSERSCGISWVRVALWWYEPTRGAERAKGRWDWTDIDTKIRLARNNGMRVIGHLDTYPPWLLERSKAGASDAELLSAWSDYARRVAERYSSGPLKVDVFEIINEANNPFLDPYLEIFRVPKPWTADKHVALYTRLYRAAYKEIRKVNPKAIISCSGVCTTDINFLKKFFDGLHANEYPDAVSVHPYSHALGTEPPEEPVGNLNFDEYVTFVDQMYGIRRKIIDKYYGRNSKVPIIVGEFMYSTGGTPAENIVSEDQQAIYCVRTVVQTLSTQMVKVFAFATVWVDWPMTQQSASKDFFSGFLNADHSPKPMYYAMHNMVEQLKGAVYVGRVKLMEGDLAYRFSRPDGRYVMVAWTLRSTAKFLIPVSKHPAAFDWKGNSVKLSDDPGYPGWPADKQVKNACIPLSDQPVYVISD